ncbi:MAG: Elongation factor Ts [Chlamydiae bacterium]|nr:Elongation factor Ts [Chlamydiota bacterium]
MATEITPQMIKELRERTGVGIGKCKEALNEAKGDMEEAISILRKAGMASAVKKEGRTANEGMIGIAKNDQTLAIVEVNAETDFVVSNERFQEFLKNIAEEVVATKPATLEAFLGQKYSKDNALTIDEYRATIVQTIGENIQIRRLKTFEKNANHSFGVYSHFGGKIVTIVEIDGSNVEEVLAKDIAMHVAAAAPEYVAPEEVPPNVLEHEKEIAKGQIQGKPDHIIEKIIEGKITKFYDNVCLNRQIYIKDDTLKIGELVEKRAKETGKPLKVASFVRWAVGQS